MPERSTAGTTNWEAVHNPVGPPDDVARLAPVGPVGLEPTTRGLTCHFVFRRRSEKRSWSGLSLHRGAVTRRAVRCRCHPSSLYTFRGRPRLGSGLPCPGSGEGFPDFEWCHPGRFRSDAPIEVRCSANCARGPSSSDCSGRRGLGQAAEPVRLTPGPGPAGPVCSPTSPTARQSPSSSGPGLHPFKVATRVRIPLGARSTARQVWNRHHPGPVAQLVSAPPCHGGGRGFESRRGR